jgi:hypothetical protein
MGSIASMQGWMGLGGARRAARFAGLMACIGWLFFTGNIQAQDERILDYHTEIEVRTDRSILVTETLKVRVTGAVIKRGITRFLPGQRELNEARVRVNYHILEVKRDGKRERYHTESSGGGKMMYLGSKDVFLDPGVYTYVIKYRVNDQIGFFEDYDEIYWNAIGNEVRFPIDKASSTVILPKGTEIVQQAAYLGYSGSGDTSYELQVQGNKLEYQATRRLNPGEGFTVAVGFEKGVMDQPGLLQRFGSLILILLASIFLLPYYIYTWFKHGRDPQAPTPYPIWTPPNGLSAASINYIDKGWYQNNSLTASVIDLAIKGFLRIEEHEGRGFFTKKKEFRLVKIKDITDDMPQEERALFKRLFLRRTEVDIDGKYDSTVESAYQKHKASLNGQHSAFIWKGHNARMLILPILVTIGVIVMSIVLYSNSSYADGANMVALVAFVPLSVISLILYGYLIRQPTMEKLELRSRIKGFQMYLEMAEKDRMRLLNPPDMTPEHFEELLPYAFALGVEHVWSERFKAILDQMQYQPRWHNSANTLYFASHFGGNFSQSVSGSATKAAVAGVAAVVFPAAAGGGVTRA